MPITINGTTVSTNSINGTSISSETVNGTQVYGGTISRVWYFYLEQSSEPSHTPYNTTVQGDYGHGDEYLGLMTNLYPPANIPVGTTGWVHSTFSGQYYLYMIIEE